MQRLFFELSDDKELINGRLITGQSMIDNAKGSGLIDGTDLDRSKSWKFVNGNIIEKTQVDSAELSTEIDRLEAGKIAKAQLAVAMKGDGALLSVITEAQFDQLNEAGRPVSTALSDGQYQTALKQWRTIFSAQSSAPSHLQSTVIAFAATQLFSELDTAVTAIIKAKIKEWDGLTDAQLAAL